MSQAVAGYITLKKSGVKLNVATDIDYTLGTPERETMVGPDGHVVYKETPKEAMCKGSFRDVRGLNIKELLTSSQETLTLTLLSGKTIVFHNAYQIAADDISTGTGEIPFQFDAEFADVIEN